MKKNELFIYGFHSIQAALIHNPWRIKNLYLNEKKIEQDDFQNLLKIAQKYSITNQLCHPDFFKKNYENYNHQGVVAMTAPLNLKNRNDLFNKIKNKADDDSMLFIFIPEMSDSHNLGAMIRTAVALGNDGIIVNPNRTPPINHTISKVSSGMVEVAEIYAISNLAQLIDELKKQNFWVYGLDANGKNINEYFKQNLLPKRKILIIGAEEKGISDLIDKKCDEMLSIKMRNEVESLNASVSFGIALNQFTNSN